MKRAIIYTRFSPRRNAEDCESCETQQAYCEQYAHNKGYTVGAVYDDKALSGSDMNRPGLGKAIAALRRGDVLLVYKRDRIARDVLLAELTLRQCRAAGATIEAVKGDIEGDDSDPTIAFVRQIMNSVAELERKQIAERTRDSMREHQRNGRRMGRYAPYGWAIDPADEKRMIPVDAEQVAIEQIVTLRNGGATYPAIAKALNKSMRDVSRIGKWTPKTIKKIVERTKA